MLKSVVSISRTLYTCLVLPQRLPCVLKGCPSSSNVRNLSLSAVWRDIDRSSLRQKENPKLTTEQDEAIKLDETKPGSLYPTAETHSMIINGTRYDELPIIHIKSTQNNTIVAITSHKGPVLTISSGGTEGFKNARKGTNIAAQAAGISAGQKALDKGVSTVRVCVRGLGPGRLPAIKGLQMAGVNIVSITDTTRIQQRGPRPRKKRRL